MSMLRAAIVIFVAGSANPISATSVFRVLAQSRKQFYAIPTVANKRAQTKLNEAHGFKRCEL
jgi:hypothetical protein